MRSSSWAALAVACLTAACATQGRREVSSVAPPTTPPQASLDSLFDSLPAATPSPSFAMLDGWPQEDHAAALAAFETSCGVSHDPATSEVCRRALAAGILAEPDARAFWEANFRPEPLGDSGLLTAYFSPVYGASRSRGGAFTAPVRPRPADLGARATYPDRAQIEARAAPDALAWMRPEDLFFLQIQGSGVLVLEDGSRLKAIYDGTNGAPFQGIATTLRQRGLLAADDTSAEAIRAWLAANRGPAADAVMRLDRRYVFFRLADDDGIEPAGAAGTPLIPGRAVAVDTARHALGEVLWIDATAPTLTGAFPAYRRVALALDAGGAIKGEVRADLYLGRGDQAGLEAGRVRHTLRLYRLNPVSRTGS